MKKYKLKSLLLACIIGITTTFSAGQITFATPDTDDLQDEIDLNNDKLDELHGEREEIESEIDAMELELDDIMSQITEKSNDLYALEVKITEYRQAIEDKSHEIDEISLQIKNKELEIETKEEELNTRKDMLDDRIRMYYKTDLATEIISMFINADSISDMFLIFNSINVLVNSDKDIMTEIEEAQEDLERIKSELESLLANLENEKIELEAIQTSLEETKIIYEEEMDNLKELENQKLTALESLSEEEKSLASSIDDLNDANSALEAKIQEIIRANAAAAAGPSTSNGTVGNFQGDFLRPVTGIVTSHFGYRIHPVTGVHKFHKGIDYGAGFGTPILASKAGTVIYSGYDGGYGNYIIIDHGDGTSTLYAHNQANYVSFGDVVGQGQTIGTVGSTGTSTGPHLHFEIRVNGEAVDPYSYIPY